MIWALDDWDAMTRRIFADVWVSMAIAYVWPRHILTRWTTAPRGRALPLPLPRSWLGGRRRTDPTIHSPLPHSRTHPKEP
jgi:hypothetical protein